MWLGICSSVLDVQAKVRLPYDLSLVLPFQGVQMAHPCKRASLADSALLRLEQSEVAFSPLWLIRYLNSQIGEIGGPQETGAARRVTMTDS